MKKTILISLLVVLSLALLAGAGCGLHLYLTDRALTKALAEAPLPGEVLSGPADGLLAREPKTEEGQKIYEALRASTSFQFNDDFSYEKETLSARQSLTVISVDLDALSARTTELFNQALEKSVEAAVLSTEVYTDQLSVREDVFDRLYGEALAEALGSLDQIPLTDTRQLRFSFKETDPVPEEQKGFLRRLSEAFPARLDAGWVPDSREEFEALLSPLIPGDMDAFADSLRGSVSSGAVYVRKSYSIPQDALSGPRPDPALFGRTTDPAVIEELLQHPYARQLIGDQETVWNAGLALDPQWPELEYYLDESILVLNWKEERFRAAFTFSEVFISDGSQLRRRIAGDTYKDKHFETPMSFAEKTNGVLTLAGDMYNHSRNCGIMVYDGEIYRFRPDKTDTCFITGDGDMLFSYRGQIKTQEEAQAFVEENDVRFSLVFGPVLIDEGVDVTPDGYAWGEIGDNYNRSVLGMIAKNHYLTLNCNRYTGLGYTACTLRNAADAMIEKGCRKAYTLDGGQTALTVFLDHYVNPAQAQYQRKVSDVIYFATAVPDLWQGGAPEEAENTG